MQFNIISYTLFLFVMAMFFLSLIYAWTHDDPPKTPSSDMKNDCAHWIEFNGFSLTSYTHNRGKAMSRDITKDKIASTWAAIYAFKISGKEDIYKILPEAFCNSLGYRNGDQLNFKALEDEYLSCKDFVKLYRFNENHSDNYIYAMNVDPSKVKYISIWTYVYWSFLYENGRTYSLTPSQLCGMMGVKDLYKMFFISDYETSLKCRDWLNLYGLDNDIPEHILHDARNLNNALKEYPIRVQYFAKTYAKNLVTEHDKRYVVFLQYTPTDFCKEFDGNDAQPRTYEFHYKMP